MPCTENIYSNSTQQQLQCATWELNGTSMWTLETPLYMSNAKKSRFCDKSLIFPWQPGLSKFFLALKSFSQSSYTFLPSWGLRNQNYYLFFLPIIFFLLIFRDILLLRHGVATIKTDDSVGRKVPSCKKTFFCSEDLGIAHLQCNDINREYFYFWLLACVTHLNIAWVKRIWKQRMFWKRECRSWCVEEPDFQKELKTGREPRRRKYYLLEPLQVDHSGTRRPRLEYKSQDG